MSREVRISHLQTDDLLSAGFERKNAIRHRHSGRLADQFKLMVKIQRSIQSLSDVFTPFFVFMILTTDGIVIDGLQFARHRTGLAVAYLTEDDLAQAHHFGSSATHEDLIRDVQLIA